MIFHNFLIQLWFSSTLLSSLSLLVAAIVTNDCSTCHGFYRWQRTWVNHQRRHLVSAGRNYARRHHQIGDQAGYIASPQYRWFCCFFCPCKKTRHKKLTVCERLNRCQLLCTGQSVAVSIQARLNRPINTLDVIQLERFQKVRLCRTLAKRWRDSVADLLQSTYASGLLYIPSLLLAKLSVSLLLRLITPNILHKKLILGVEIVTVFWAVSSEIAAAFQCHLPVPWKFLGGNTCFDRVGHYSTWLRRSEHWREHCRRRSGLTLGLWILSQTWLLCYYHLALSGNYRLLQRGKLSLLDALHLE